MLVGIFLSFNVPQIIDPLLKEAPTQEYIIIVAYMYDREGVLQNARDRLGKLGDKGSDKAILNFSATYAKNYPEKVREAQSLSRLAKDLEISRPPAGGEPTAGGGFPWGWVILGTLVLGMAAIFFTSVANGRFKSFVNTMKGRSTTSSRPRSGYGRRTSGQGPVETIIPDETDGAEDSFPAEPTSDNPVTKLVQEVRRVAQSNILRIGQITGRSSQDTSGVPIASYGDEREAPDWAADIKEDSPEISSDAGRLLQSIQAHYVTGQDVYREIYPILEERSAVMIGACGLSPGFALDPNHADDYHAIVVWLHDYRTPHSVRNAVLLSRGLCYGARPAELEHWLRSQRIQSILPAEAGRSATLDAAALRARLTVLQVETYPPNDPSGGIATLEVRLDISQKGPHRGSPASRSTPPY